MATATLPAAGTQQQRLLLLLGRRQHLLLLPRRPLPIGARLARPASSTRRCLLLLRRRRQPAQVRQALCARAAAAAAAMCSHSSRQCAHQHAASSMQGVRDSSDCASGGAGRASLLHACEQLLHKRARQQTADQLLQARSCTTLVA
jgi:hypothetical protein